MRSPDYRELSRETYLNVCYSLYNGNSTSNTAFALGVALKSVKIIKTQAGLSSTAFPNPNKTGTKLLSTREVSDLLKLRARGMTVTETAVMLDVSGATISYIEDEIFNVAEKVRTGSHYRKLTRARKYALDCTDVIRDAALEGYQTERDTRKLARSLNLCEYRIKAILEHAISAPLVYRKLAFPVSPLPGRSMILQVSGKGLTRAQRHDLCNLLYSSIDLAEIARKFRLSTTVTVE